MENKCPTLIVIAGQNGSGNTSLPHLRRATGKTVHNRNTSLGRHDFPSFTLTDKRTDGLYQ